MYHIKAIKVIICDNIVMQKEDIVAICVDRKDIHKALHDKRLIECLSLMGYQRLDACIYRQGVEYHTGYFNRIDSHTYSILPYDTMIDNYKPMLSERYPSEY